MSLIHWWPLSENTKDIVGGAHLNGTYATSGKGKISNGCASEWSTRLSTSTSNLTGLKNFSIAMWVRLDSAANSNAWSDLFGMNMQKGSTTESLRAEVNTTGGNALQLYCNNISGTSGGAANFTLIKDTWQHLVITKNGARLASYINGSIVNYTDWSNITDAYCTGEFHLSDGGFYCSYNDVRLYNHVLSTKEIKELSKGLVLHYPCNQDVSEPTTNYITYPTPGSAVSSSWTASLHPGAISVTGWSYGYNGGVSNPTVGYHAMWNVIDDIPTIVFQNKNSAYSATGRWLGVSGGISSTVNSELTGRTVTLSYEARGDRSGMKIAAGLYYTIGSSTGFHGGCPAQDITTSWARYSHTFTVSSSKTGSSSIYIYGHQGGEGTSYVRNIQLEYKDHATEYIKDSRMGIMYNAAGYENTLSCVGSPSFVNDSPIRDKSVDFNGLGYYKNDSFSLTTTEYTVSFWFKMPSTTTNQHFLWGLFNNWSLDGTGMYRNKSAGSYSILVRGTSAASYLEKIYTFTANTWNHVVMTYTGAQTRVYVNGGAATVYDYSGGTVVFSKIYLGNSRYNGAPTSEIDEAQMSDFRVYATAIDKDMDTSTKISSTVQEMYKSRWAANRQGQVFSYSVNENKSKFQITRGGVNNCNQVYESGVVPSGYLALNGIKMERVPWINTGVVFNNAHTQIMVAADVTPTATSGNNCLAGCGNSSWTGPVMLNFCNGRLEFGTNGYSTSSEAQGIYVANERLVVHAVIDYNSQKWFKNGVQIKNITSRTCPTTTAPLYIGTFKTPSSSVGNGNSFRGFIHYFEVKYGSIHKKFIPCKRLADSVLGMYEINEGIFYSPEGGTYTAGPQAVSQSRDGSLYCAEFNEI